MTRYLDQAKRDYEEFEGRDGREAACTEYCAHVEHLLTKEYGPTYAEGQ